MKRKIIGFYSVFLGVSVIAIWILIYLTEDISEGPLEMAFHLSAEGLMAFTCIAGGLMVISGRKRADLVILLGHAMIVYSVINAAGYYVQRGESVAPVLFMVLMVVSMAIIHATISGIRTSQ